MSIPYRFKHLQFSKNRLEAFSYAVFAIVITLLVINKCSLTKYKGMSVWKCIFLCVLLSNTLL